MYSGTSTLLNSKAPDENKDLLISIQLCDICSINGTYSNDFFPSAEHKSLLAIMLTTEMLNIMHNKIIINPNHIFIQQSFYNANSDHNFILFLSQNPCNILQNKWFIARSKDHILTLKLYKSINIELLYFNIDRISSKYYLPPCTQWMSYTPYTDMLHTYTFEPEAVDLDSLLIASIDPIPRWHSIKYDKYRRTYDVQYSNTFYEEMFDNVYDASIKYKAIDDVRWFSNAHSWYKHLPITGRKYWIYPNYNAMTRGYSRGTRCERQLRWSMSSDQYLNKLKFEDNIKGIIDKYGAICFNRAFCGINRSNVYGDSDYGKTRYLKSGIHKNSAQFTNEESEQQIENAVRAAFKIHDEIMTVFDRKKQFVYSYWLRINGVRYVVKEIESIIISYIFLEFEIYAFQNVPVYQWNRYKTNRYFRRLIDDLQLIDGLFDTYDIDGVHLLNLNVGQMAACNINDVVIQKRIFDEINVLFNGLDFCAFIEYQLEEKYIYVREERVREVENKNALKKMKNVNFFQFKSNGKNEEFYTKLNVLDEKVIDICKNIHSKCCGEIRLSKDSFW